MMRDFISDLRREQAGVSVVEFALVAPVLLMMLLGFFDIAHNMYANTMLQGSVQQAARKSSLEAADAAAIDAAVEKAVKLVANNATVSFKRKAYTTFSNIAKAEDYTDVNNDGICNAGEPFEDANGNGIWDSDQGETGMGGARDAVLYEVTISYPRAFPIVGFVGLSPNHETIARTVLRNQPFDERIERTTIEHCT